MTVFVYYSEEVDKIFVPMPRAASTSLVNALTAKGDTTKIRWRQFLKPNNRWMGKETVSFWREPYRRIESVFGFFMQNDGLRPRLHGNKNFDDWILWLCRQQSHEMHTASQYHHCCDRLGRFFVDTIIFWDFDEFKRKFRIDGNIEKTNQRYSPVQYKWTEDARKAFEIRYGKSLDLWQNSRPVSASKQQRYSA